MTISLDSIAPLLDSQLTSPAQRIKCDWCGETKKRSDFYKRSGNAHLVLQGCKECRKADAKRKHHAGPRISKHETATPSEAWALARLRACGIPAYPGKAFAYVDTDVVAFGCVTIEVKSSTLKVGGFSFHFTPKQQSAGVRGDLVVLICDYGDRQTFHVLPSNHDVFYNERGSRKHSVSFVPGQTTVAKHKRRNVLLQPVMNAAQDNWQLVWDQLMLKSAALKEGVA